MCNGVAQLNRWPVLYWVLLPRLVTVTELLSIPSSQVTTLREYTGREGDDAGINDFSSFATRGHCSLFASQLKYKH